MNKSTNFCWNKKVSRYSQKYEAAQLFSTPITIRNVCWAANQHIRMISEGSCDTEDWSNDAENSALIIRINYILTYINFKITFLCEFHNLTEFLKK